MNATWKPRERFVHSDSPSLSSLQMITFNERLMEIQSPVRDVPLVINSELISVSSTDPMEMSRSICLNIPKYVHDKLDFQREPPLNIPEEYEQYIWFIIPRQVIVHLSNDQENNRSNIRAPFHPRPIKR